MKRPRGATKNRLKEKLNWMRLVRNRGKGRGNWKRKKSNGKKLSWAPPGRWSLPLLLTPLWRQLLPPLLLLLPPPLHLLLPPTLHLLLPPLQTLSGMCPGSSERGLKAQEPHLHQNPNVGSMCPGSSERGLKAQEPHLHQNPTVGVVEVDRTTATPSLVTDGTMMSIGPPPPLAAAVAAQGPPSHHPGHRTMENAESGNRCSIKFSRTVPSFWECSFEPPCGWLGNGFAIILRNDCQVIVSPFYCMSKCNFVLY
ncbi:hypothetical protein EUGRSUZ_H03272 [Eucalyptus grandis]|uniref:Uncharacterized protein n=3 Tax=Eucalyptus grandis TaxID=71139 RepID=A0A059B3S5_EUCGR|nr:hypothetical protein EUGRSUZ_H03272 [Eucalyptus grandis]KAK3418693.1 hypothetical protein EUGRSUZ_H03272 [Eucalyptus grandis]